MEELKTLLLEKWPDILTFLAMVVGYFLLFLFRGKVNGTRDTLKQAFKDTTTAIEEKINTEHQDAIAKLDSATAERDLDAAQVQYYEQRIANIEKAIEIMNTEEVAKDDCIIDGTDREVTSTDRAD